MLNLKIIVALILLNAAFNFAIAVYCDSAVNLMAAFFSVFVCIAVFGIWPISD